MATLVLTAVGTAVGGPIGGALGSLVGQAIDTQLFGKGPRRGPRLDDLKVQTSTYGTQIPRLYGRMRVAGTVIWATDLIQSESLEGGGKGSPETLAYHYSCSFAVALSSRPIRSIGRIWADGKLIRGAAGDLKVKGQLRVHAGSEGQALDPLIDALESTSGSPAYRGLALAVFEDLDLGEFGDRLPMLTFEVVADDAPVEVGALIDDATGGAVESRVASDDLLGGYAVLGSDQRSAVEQLCDLLSVRVRAVDGVLVAGATEPRHIERNEERGWSTGSKTYPANGEWTQDAVGTLPARLSIRYHDPDREYQAGLMQAVMPGGREEMTFDSAAMSTAPTVKMWAERALARRWSGRDRLMIRLSPDHLDLMPGDCLELGWRAGRWLVAEVQIEGYAVVAECRRLSDAATPALADPGRSTSEQDSPIGRSIVALFDMPDLGDPVDGRLRLHAAVSAAGAFKPVPLTSAVGGLAGPSGLASRKARIGTATTALPAAPSTVMDMGSMIDLQLVDPAQVLLNADFDLLDNGANLCAIGDELLQFGRAEELGGGWYRISQLLRGRRGTEWAITGHVSDERFVMVDRASLVPLVFDASQLGQVAEVWAHGVADDAVVPPTACSALNGAATRPLSPCHVRVDQGTLKWVRRARDNWRWTDGAVDPLAPTAYEVSLAGGSGSLQRTTDNEELSLEVADRDLLGAGPVAVSIVEINSGRRSMPVHRVAEF